MCVIVYKPKEKSLKDIKDLKACFEHNPDGAGFMFNDEKGVHIHKGFMSYKALRKALKSVPDGVDLVIHFRIGTSGTNSKGNCHPYPLYSAIDDMKALSYTCEYGLAHNGVLYDFSPDEKNNKHDMNDTQLFIYRFLNGIKTKSLFSNNMLNAIDSLIDGSKLAIMNKNKVRLIGKFIDHNGIFYSNRNHDTSYHKPVARYHYYYDDLYEDLYDDDIEKDYSWTSNCYQTCYDCDKLNCIHNDLHDQYLNSFWDKSKNCSINGA